MRFLANWNDKDLIISNMLDVICDQILVISVSKKSHIGLYQKLCSVDQLLNAKGSTNPGLVNNICYVKVEN